MREDETLGEIARVIREEAERLGVRVEKVARGPGGYRRGSGYGTLVVV